MKTKKIFFLLMTFACMIFVFSTKIYAYDNSDTIIGLKYENGLETSEYLSDIKSTGASYTLPKIINDIDYSSFYNPTERDDSDVIIGSNDRVQLTESQYSLSPYCMICKIEATFGQSVYQGTGYLVGPRTVLTAAHVIYDSGWGTNVTLLFGAHWNSNNQYVYSSYVTNVTGLTMGNYYNTGDTADDWAIIDLGFDIGDTYGWFGLTTVVTTNMTMTVAGYPGDYNGNMVYSTGSVSNIETYKFRHYADTAGGESGAPIMPVPFMSSGIHHGGYGTSYNEACRISTYIVDMIDERIGNDDDN